MNLGVRHNINNSENNNIDPVVHNNASYTRL